MDKLETLSNALGFIEENLQNEIRVKDVAAACFCSRSVLEKIFRCVSSLSVQEYILKRRMTIAARMIAGEKACTLLEIALACGYSSNEAFDRAFKRVWHCNPSQFKDRKRVFELFPRLRPPIQDGGIYMRERRHVDIGEMYDLFVQRKNCYFVCCDIRPCLKNGQPAHWRCFFRHTASIFLAIHKVFPRKK